MSEQTTHPTGAESTPRTPSETLEAARAMNVLEGLLCDCPGSGKRERAWVAASDALARLTERNRVLEEALREMRDEVLHSHGPLEVNDVLGIIDHHTPALTNGGPDA